MKINIRLLTGKHFEFDVNESDTIDDLITKASPSIPINSENIIFIYETKILENSQKIDELELNPKSFLIVANKEWLKEEKVKSQLCQVIKSKPVINIHKDRNGHIVPWNVDALVNFIVNLSYTPEHALAALEYTIYDLHKAISLLSTGKAIGIDGQEHSVTVDLDPNYDNKSKYVTYEENEEPTVPIRRTEEEKKLAETMKGFTEEEKQAVIRLSFGRDKSIVVQVFMACDKDEALTESCLNTMN
ncbi:hypothetical protein TRFO_29023 [Tritrichomonas foetus]|uniref:Ubiquitin-like domain-containing protein n=1 Tax=Tritrichomonas foetus TaxID=1144522 RepID=A0A1J4K1G8_9EUKA|nr:hypothetical protein TRFO_29023 [Tritrichomonas foetus]|eukprot:OHT03588.1 hypothetical protein TRFO_29023 [Tritrichomonas foetus]